jgi:hypothetical protein
MLQSPPGRPFGKTGVNIPRLGYGAASAGHPVRGLPIGEHDALGEKEPGEVRAKGLLLPRNRDDEEIVVRPAVGLVVPAGHRPERHEPDDARVGLESGAKRLRERGVSAGRQGALPGPVPVSSRNLFHHSLSFASAPLRGTSDNSKCRTARERGKAGP